MIRFADIVVQYPRANRRALDGVSFEAPRGRITAVVGPNGSGKSTLVRALLRLVAPTSGSAFVDEQPVDALPRPRLARSVSFVTQSESLTFPTTVAEYVALGRFPHIGAWHRVSAEDRRAMERATELTGIDDLLDRSMDALSGGERQRVRLARALAQGGEAIVLDEPTAFLDIGHEMVVFELLSKLAADGHAVLLVSHQLNLVARFASTMVLLDAGKVVAAGGPADVMRADVLERVYAWPIEVTKDSTGVPTLTPRRAQAQT